MSVVTNCNKTHEVTKLSTNVINKWYRRDPAQKELQRQLDAFMDRVAADEFFFLNEEED